jgi:hypothetical protein
LGVAHLGAEAVCSLVARAGVVHRDPGGVRKPGAKHIAGFIEEQAPSGIILDLDTTDDPVHGEQEGRIFHCYCYLPLYVFCGRHLLDAKLRRASLDAADGAVEAVARIVAQVRRRWPKVRILVRADSGFAFVVGGLVVGAPECDEDQLGDRKILEATEIASVAPKFRF